ncbi:hypothetical protein NC981_11655 [Leptolyngbya sp. DQ-M1]|uniref:hypothetical protein n=1 Tax=Leptolyngbya sp. DQ-M1 TaxID=2933920 RepID=UPI003296A635
MDLSLAVAANPNMPPNQLQKMAETAIEMLKRRFPGINLIGLDEQLKQSLPESIICLAIAQNPNTSPETLLRLAWVFPLQVLYSPVMSLLLLEEEDFLYRLYQYCPDVLRLERLPNFVLNWAANHHNATLRVNLANSWYTSQVLLECLSREVLS